MPIHRTCTFCGEDMEPGRGKMFIRRDGTVLLFCSSKCQKNQLKLGRVGRTVRWTKRYAARAGGPGALAREGLPTPVTEPPEAPAEATSPKGGG